MLFILLIFAAMSEKELIRELKRGSYEAFDKLYASYSPQLYSFCLNYTKSESDSLSIVQDTFIRLWRIRDVLRDADSLRPLLFTIAKHNIYEAYSKRLNSVLYGEYVSYSHSECTTFADARITYLEFVSVIKEKLKKYPMTQRKVISLSRLEGYSNKEISALLQISEQTVKNQLSMGLRKLRLELAPIVGEILAILPLIILSQ